MSEPTADWASLASDFSPDGSLRDIYIFDTTVEDWQAIVDRVRRADVTLRFFVDGETAQLPERVADVFAIQQRATPSLRIETDGIGINCHFFARDEVEFDVDPREILGPAKLDVVVRFMKLLSETVRKAVVLTHENAPSAVILRCAGQSCIAG